MNRRSLLQAATIGTVIGPARSLQQSTPVAASRDLVTHAVANALRETSPLLVYSGIKSTSVETPSLIEFAETTPEVEPWVDWNDEDLANVFAAFFVSTPNSSIGSIRIFDTPDIAWSVQRALPQEFTQGYMDVGGMRAVRVVAEDTTYVSLRLWNVIIDTIAPDETSDIAMGMVKYLGTAIGAVE